MRQQVVDDVLVSKHPAGTVAADLAARLAAASTDPIRHLYTPPLSALPIAAPDGRLITLSPVTDPLPEDQPAPWHEAGALLARLHAVAVPDVSSHRFASLFGCSCSIRDSARRPSRSATPITFTATVSAAGAPM